VPCTQPLRAYRARGGSVVFNRVEATGPPFDLPCGQCRGCRIQRSQEWAVRCVHEAQMHTRYDQVLKERVPCNAFVSLTYRDEDLPEGGSLDVRDWQLFAKRLRKKFPFRYFQCGEYGDTNRRPHHHALLFGVDFCDDRYFWRNRRGHRYYRSATLEEAWQKGNCEFSDVTLQSAAYVARYCVKKMSNPQAENPDVRFEQEKKFAKYERFDDETGEVYYVRPEFVTMSRDPAIGVSWLKKFRSDVFPSDEVIHEGRRYRTPRRYDDVLDELELDQVKAGRRDKVRKHAKDLTADRLVVREKLLNKRVGRLLRDV